MIIRGMHTARTRRLLRLQKLAELLHTKFGPPSLSP